MSRATSVVQQRRRIGLAVTQSLLGNLLFNGTLLYYEDVLGFCRHTS